MNVLGPVLRSLECAGLIRRERDHSATGESSSGPDRGNWCPQDTIELCGAEDVLAQEEVCARAVLHRLSARSTHP